MRYVILQCFQNVQKTEIKNVECAAALLYIQVDSQY